jgi:hypothetical protein
MSDLSHLSVERPFDVEALRQRFVQMTDAQLKRFGEAARYMCSPPANRGKPPREEFVIQLREARLECRRRHPKPKDPVLTSQVSG